MTEVLKPDYLQVQYSVFKTIHISFVQLAKSQSQKPIKKITQ